MTRSKVSAFYAVHSMAVMTDDVNAPSEISFQRGSLGILKLSVCQLSVG